MNVQADRNWVISELKKIDDPGLIEAFKQLLLHLRGSTADIDFDQAMIRALKDKNEGRVSSHDDVRTKYDKWL